ncbi:uncharacterized protein LOC110432672 [Sorghum bicolor]|uniref:uncharacterized protein LOC110432672 n=1 Tax=Sorghum bicolor TaxID=4558 RepID=UPI000B423B45|nr:uncharacterized protein LOC110432672 [Sorghum bicolor]|eukprot:XP_021309127.1 uncharacterized protein LOC110432672 [Sorghum bicolor]
MLPVESSQAPKRRRLVRIADDDDEEEAAPSLVRRPRSRSDNALATTDRVASDPPAPRVAETGAPAPTGRARRSAASDVNPDQVTERRTAEPAAAVEDAAPQAAGQPAAAAATTGADGQTAPGTMTTAKYRKRCFDQIEGIVPENKTLAAECSR